MRNPRYHPGRVLGLSKADYAARRGEIAAFLDAQDNRSKADYAARRGEIAAFLDAQDNREQIPEAEIRAALTVAVSDAVWRQLKGDLGLRN